MIKGLRIGYRKVDLVRISSHGILSTHRFFTSSLTGGDSRESRSDMRFSTSPSTKAATLLSPTIIFNLPDNTYRETITLVESITLPLDVYVVRQEVHTGKI